MEVEEALVEEEELQGVCPAIKTKIISNHLVAMPTTYHSS